MQALQQQFRPQIQGMISGQPGMIYPTTFRMQAPIP
jgi:hypothetical protein